MSLFGGLGGLLSDERQTSKLHFASNVVPRLSRQDISADDSTYWASYWTIGDVQSLLSPHVLRSARPGNIATLIKIVAEHLIGLMTNPDFPKARPAVVALHQNALAQRPLLERMTSSGSSRLPREPDYAREALNCVRVLTRVLPFVFERRATDDDPFGVVEHGIFWTAERTNDASAERQFVLEDDDDPDRSARANESFQSAASVPASDATALGTRLLNAVVDLLYVSGFSLPDDFSPGPGRIARVIWEPGIGSTVDIHPTREQDAAKAELVKLLVVLVSGSLYGGEANNLFLRSLVRLPSRKAALSLLCSLMNVALAPASSPPATAAFTRSISSAASTVPGIGAMLSSVPLPKSIPAISRTTHHRRELGFASAIVLSLVLLGDGSENLPNEPPSSPAVEKGPPSFAVEQDSNVFRRYLSKLHRAADFDFLLDRIMTFVTSAADQGGIEGDGDGLGLVEALVLLWRIVDCNEHFLSHVLGQANVAPRLLCALLVICLERKDDPPAQQQSAQSLIRLCVLLLQSLSAHRNFGARLNVPIASIGIRGATSGRFAVQGSVADYLVIAIYTLVCTTQGRLSSLYQPLLLILVNCSPYLKQLGLTPSTRLVQLFLAFSSPSFLLAEESNPRLTIHVLEVFNQIIHRNFGDNVHLIYAIIRSHRRFEELATFSLSLAVTDIRRMRAELRSNGVDIKPTLSSASLVSSGGEDNKSPPSPTSQTAPLMSPIAEAEQPYPVLSEKARGKMRARSFDETPLDGSVDDLSASILGSNAIGDPGHPGPYTSRSGFTPTESWVASWRERLPLDTILILLSELRPKVTSLVAVRSSSTNQAALEYLRSATLLGLLPPAPPIKPRAFAQTALSIKWLQSLVWSRAYIGMHPIFGGTRVGAFSVRPSGSGPTSPIAEVTEMLTRPLFRSRASSVASRTSSRLPSGTV